MNPSLIRLLILALATLACAMTSQAADRGELFSCGGASKLLGQPVAGPMVIGPEKDDASPAQATHWIYRAAGAGAAVVVSRLDFASPAEARNYATIAFVKKQNDAEEARITEEPGVGEKAYWATTGEGCSITFLKGAQIASVALGGGNLGSPESHKAAMKAAAIGIAAKL